MKVSVCVLALFLSAVPAFAQNAPEDSAQGELGAFGAYSLGDLAVLDYQRGNDPVQQLKGFFGEAKQPLSSVQEKQLTSIVDVELKALQAGAQAEDLRRLNLEYNRKVNEALTPDQRAALRRYRTEQIMMRGGFPALKLILENAQAPFAAGQESRVQALYSDLNRQVEQFKRESQGPPNRVQLYNLEHEALGQVVRLLTPEQRRALAASRQGSLASRVRP
jgi:Spy/CpxP family protein refolding chaperone